MSADAQIAPLLEREAALREREQAGSGFTDENADERVGDVVHRVWEAIRAEQGFRLQATACRLVGP